MNFSRTIETKGVKTVAIRTTGHEKNAFTVVLAVCASGKKLPPMPFKKKRNDRSVYIQPLSLPQNTSPSIAIPTGGSCHFVTNEGLLGVIQYVLCWHFADDSNTIVLDQWNICEYHWWTLKAGEWCRSILRLCQIITWKSNHDWSSCLSCELLLDCRLFQK